MSVPFVSPAPILLVEDSDTDAVLIADMLVYEAQHVVDLVRARSMAEAVDELGRRPFLCVLLDLGLPDSGGVGAVRTVLDARSSVPVVVVTGTDEQKAGVQAIQAGAQDYLIKDHLEGATLWRAVRYAVERKHVEEQLAHAALHDALTGLPNRALLRDRLASALGRLGRYRGTVGLLFVDIDRFKLINDTLGHAAGDEVLGEMAARLSGVVRAGDTVARFGGDEFVVLCEELTGEVEAVGMAERMAEATARPFLVEGTEIAVTVSTGIALASTGDVDGEDLLRDADTALYRAKQDGRSRSTVFAQWMRARTSERLKIETSLRRAIDEGELRLHYQPIVDLDGGAIVAVEALVRWLHPQRGLLPPSEFVPVAEETGLIVALGDWVLREACRQVAEWRADGGPSAGMRVSVNLSGHHLARADLVDTVESCLRSCNLDPSALMLELTETVLMTKADAAVGVLVELKRLGVGLLIDDFGTGYSSLSYLRRFPVDTLKIDRSFVAGLGQSTEDAAIVGAVVALAAALSLQTVAEGVETREQLEQARALGCSTAQGYLFSPPRPADEVAALVEAYHGQVPARRRAGPNVVVCDDESAIRELYGRALRRAGAVVAEAEDASECLALAERLEPDLVVLDVVLPGRGGLEVLEELRRRCPDALIVLVSGSLADDVAAEGRALGASECVPKMQFLPRVADLVARCQERARFSSTRA